MLDPEVPCLRCKGAKASDRNKELYRDSIGDMGRGFGPVALRTSHFPMHADIA